ncbi:sulfite exporter TauE/SafE family protein [Flavicella sp.]|uniref:sulfite exporter TauE/SafE family protein n=1 Tax=Flavicella sp. TaxID=2957742 RepID=UPI00301AB339
MTFTETLLTSWDIILSFFTIAILYASVGFGGGSSYLAILALASLEYIEIRATSLICNIVVVSNSFFLYYKAGYYNFKKVLPLVLTSIPLAFIGGYLRIEEKFFFILLSTTLLIAGILMLLRKKEINKINRNQHTSLKSLGFGGFIGFISGMVGIGGGIFLAPLLHLTNWDTSKKIAATASLFILVNSIAGLSGQLTNPDFSINTTLTIILGCTVFLGGQIGTRIGIKLINPNILKKATALLILYIAIKIILKHL